MQPRSYTPTSASQLALAVGDVVQVGMPCLGNTAIRLWQDWRDGRFAAVWRAQ